jgi:osmotically-inducible protein OsmY
MKSDKKLRQAIEVELRSDPLIAVFPISVDVSDGIATLSGTVRSFEQKYRLHDVAKRVRGLAGLVVDVGIEHLDPDEDSNVETRHELRNAPL